MFSWVVAASSPQYPQHPPSFPPLSRSQVVRPLPSPGKGSGLKPAMASKEKCNVLKTETYIWPSYLSCQRALQLPNDQNNGFGEQRKFNLTSRWMILSALILIADLYLKVNAPGLPKYIENPRFWIILLLVGLECPLSGKSLGPKINGFQCTWAPQVH